MDWLSHPLHPLTVHFPIVFYILGVALTLRHLWRNEAQVERLASYSFVLSGGTALLSSLFGLIDQNQLVLDDPRRADVESHITSGVALLIINGLLVYLRFRWPDVLSRYRLGYLSLMGAGLLVLLITAWLGGNLVYQLGVGVY